MRLATVIWAILLVPREAIRWWRLTLPLLILSALVTAASVTFGGCTNDAAIITPTDAGLETGAPPAPCGDARQND